MGKLIDVNDIGLTDFEIVVCDGDYKEALTMLCRKIDKAKEVIIRCKDCIHRPTGDAYNHDLKFPDKDYKCPCRCEDFWYSWMPDDDWYCANGERKTNGTN